MKQNITILTSIQSFKIAASDLISSPIKRFNKHLFNWSDYW